MAKVAVLGGGISGLSACYYLQKYMPTPIKKVILLESTSHLGGWIQSKKFPDGAVLECGPRSIRPVGINGAATLAMVEELDMTHEILPITKDHPSAKNRMILYNDNLYPLPNSWQSLFRITAPFTKPLILYLLKEFFTKKKAVQDESIYDFACRRFGKEIADLAVDPLCRGVFAGNSHEISVLSLFKPLLEAEQNYGSVIKGMLKKKNKAIKDKFEEDLLTLPLVERARRERWAMWSLKNGLQSLPAAITAKLLERGIEVHHNTPCKKIEVTSGSAKIWFNNECMAVNHIFCALPAGCLSILLNQSHLKMSQLLAEIHSVTVGVVSLEYQEKLDKQAFGFLVPSSQKSDILGIVFDSCNFPEHNGSGGVSTRLTVMMGGHWFESLFGGFSTDLEDKLLHTAMEAVRKHLQIKSDPLRYEVLVQKECIPQYVVGHSERIDKIQCYIEENNLPISLLGASYKGVSVNDCIYNSKLAVNNLIDKKY